MTWPTLDVPTEGVTHLAKQLYGGLIAGDSVLGGTLDDGPSGGIC